MCPEGQQLQYGNYVSQFCFVQRKVLLLVCVALRVCICDKMREGVNAPSTCDPSLSGEGKKGRGEKGERGRGKGQMKEK